MNLLRRFATAFKSRKAAAALGTTLFVVLSEVFGLKLSEETIQTVLALAITYIAGTAVEDGLRGFKAGASPPNEPPNTPKNG